LALLERIQAKFSFAGFAMSNIGTKGCRFSMNSERRGDYAQLSSMSLTAEKIVTSDYSLALADYLH
jgi:hypothetical protein